MKSCLHSDNNIRHGQIDMNSNPNRPSAICNDNDG